MNFYERIYKEEKMLIVSNDAFFYLLRGETCLDDNNRNEADAILHKFGINYDIKRLRDASDGRVYILIKPFDLIESSHRYTKYIELFNNWQLEIEQLNAKRVYIRLHNTKTGETAEHQECEIQYLDKGHTQIKTARGSVYPLWDSTSNTVKEFIG